VGQLIDDPSSWPAEGQLELDGFSYDELGGIMVPLRAIGPGGRLEWLKLQNQIRAQPYQQLITVLRKMGYANEADEVAIGEEEAAFKSSNVSLVGKFWNGILFLTVGYGYRPWLAFYWVLALLTLGTLLSRLAFRLGIVVPTDEKAMKCYESSERKGLPQNHPRFHALLYAIDQILPLASRPEVYLATSRAPSSRRWLLDD
jgi:hypothetical protein